LKTKEMYKKGFKFSLFILFGALACLFFLKRIPWFWIATIVLAPLGLFSAQTFYAALHPRAPLLKQLRAIFNTYLKIIPGLALIIPALAFAYQYRPLIAIQVVGNPETYHVNKVDSAIILPHASYVIIKNQSQSLIDSAMIRYRLFSSGDKGADLEVMQQAEDAFSFGKDEARAIPIYFGEKYAGKSSAGLHHIFLIVQVRCQSFFGTQDRWEAFYYASADGAWFLRGKIDKEWGDVMRQQYSELKKK